MSGRGGERDDEDRGSRRSMQRLGDLLPSAARALGLEEELALARAMNAWTRIAADLIPEAASACRLVSIDRGTAIIEADEPIVAQEIRLRSLELVGALRTNGVSVREVRAAVRHV